MPKIATVRASLFAITALASLLGYASAETARQVDIPSGDLSSALLQLSKETNADLVYRPEQVKGLKTRGAHGSLTTEQAVNELLRGTKLGVTVSATGSMLIAAPGSNLPATQGDSRTSPTATNDPNKEAGKNSSQDFRVAQMDPAPAGPQITGADQSVEKKPVPLEEVVVTGSRIPLAKGDGPQPVQVYSSADIQRSGQSNIGDFLSTLPEVSVAVRDNGYTFGAGVESTVQLHGLPIGTTLVLLNGRRLEGSGQSGSSATSGSDFFDLNNIPVSAIDRVEVLTAGSSAVYGSDAIAGVVNIILRQDIEGFEANVKYGAATSTDEASGNLAWGKKWDRGSFSIVASAQTNSALLASERALTSGGDFTVYGGPDTRSYSCNPGNVYTLDGSPLPGGPPGSQASYAAVSQSSVSGKPASSNFAYGSLNKCNLTAYTSLIPKRTEESVYAQGHYKISDQIDVFSELLVSYYDTRQQAAPQSVYGQPGYTPVNVPASNPFNPFGETVGISYLLSGAGPTIYPTSTLFVRPLIGARGGFFGDWKWEIAGWSGSDWTDSKVPSQDPSAVQAALNSSNPATALNPFISGPAAPASVLQSFIDADRFKFSGRTIAINGYVRGPIFQLPWGAVELAIGAEYDRDRLYVNQTPFAEPMTLNRTSRSAFSEVRIPLIASRESQHAADVLALTAAARYDDYSDFGNKTTPQFGVEFRPIQSLLFRGTYAKAFKAPTLPELYDAGITITGIPVSDPLNGNAFTSAAVTFNGGNLNLKPETGQSRTFGVVYRGDVTPGLTLSATYWGIDESNSIQELDPQTVVDNEALFPGAVTRGPSVNGAAGPITVVNAGFVNFGTIRVAGIDYLASYDVQTPIGKWSPYVTATQTLHYYAALTPMSPPIDSDSKAQDSGNWAPRWKGAAGVKWAQGPFTVAFSGRYVGRYQDYDSQSEIGNFWLFDANLRYSLGEALNLGPSWHAAYLSVGGVNVFNKLPQFSNFDAANPGYDPAQADIRGRFLYLQLGVKM